MSVRLTKETTCKNCGVVFDTTIAGHRCPVCDSLYRKSPLSDDKRRYITEENDD